VQATDVAQGVGLLSANPDDTRRTCCVRKKFSKKRSACWYKAYKLNPPRRQACGSPSTAGPHLSHIPTLLLQGAQQNADPLPNDVQLCGLEDKQLSFKWAEWAICKPQDWNQRTEYPRSIWAQHGQPQALRRMSRFNRPVRWSPFCQVFTRRPMDFCLSCWM